jgi:hypothetical protein
MRKRLLSLFAILVLVALPAIAELEIGAGITPSPSGSGDDPSSESGDFMSNSFQTLHLGWRTLGILYITGDFMVVPPGIAKGMTSYFDEAQNTWVEGIYRPAVISVYDVGFKIKIKNFSFWVQGGLNQFYLYRQAELENFNPPNIGANIKVGLGLRLFKFLGVEASAISVQPSFEDAVSVITNVFSEDELIQKDALDKLVDQLVPSIQLVIYL